MGQILLYKTLNFAKFTILFSIQGLKIPYLYKLLLLFVDLSISSKYLYFSFTSLKKILNFIGQFRNYAKSLHKGDWFLCTRKYC